MVVDDRRLHVGDLRPLCEAIDDEGIQGVGVLDGNMDEEVVSARDHEDADRLR
jgi:hypothetical protein